MKKWNTLLLIALTVFAVACGKDESANQSAVQTTPSGITVSSNKIISNPATDFCTEFAGEACYFRGGQRVTYSDGSVLITGGWAFLYSSGGGDTDTNEVAVTMWVPSTLSTSSQILSTFVARGAGYKNVFLVYNRSTDTVSLWHDTNGSGSYGSASDTLLYTATLSDWP